jgi:Fe-S cluster assembly protein SufD
MSEVITDQEKDIKDRFSAMFETYEGSLNGSQANPMKLLRHKAMEKLNLSDFPNRKSEDWKYTAVSPILKPNYVVPEMPEDATIPTKLTNPIELESSIQILFVNGHYIDEHTKKYDLPDGVFVGTLEEAIKNEAFKITIQNRLERQIQEPQNAFELLNMAFGKNGIFIRVDKNIQLVKPIEIVYLNTRSKESYFTHPQIIVYAEKGSSCKIIERYESADSEKEYLSNALLLFEIGQNARIDFVKIQRESNKAFHIHQISTNQHQDSRFHSYIIDTGGNMVRNTHATYLRGENTETHLLGNYIATGDQSIDNQTFIDHAIPNCYSNELYKGIAADRGKAVFNGKILVRQDAQKTNAFQQNASLVLSPFAVIDAKPQLEIFADDVKCSHGATIGQLDEDSVFYLRSRGLSENASRRMLQKAFVDEVVDHLAFEEVQPFAHTLIDEKLSSLGE